MSLSLLPLPMDKTPLSSKELRLELPEGALASIKAFLETYRNDIEGAVHGGLITDDITVINTAINRGIVFHCDRMDHDKETWQDLLRGSISQLLGNEYALDHGYISTDGTKKNYFVYIKPNLRLRAQLPVKQLFGNLFFELSIDKGKAIKWQLLSNVYHGRTYQDALALEDLIDAMWWSGVGKKTSKANSSNYE